VVGSEPPTPGLYGCLRLARRRLRDGPRNRRAARGGAPAGAPWGVLGPIGPGRFVTSSLIGSRSPARSA
jgi:hypothetical protein